MPDYCPGTDCPLAWHCRHAQAPAADSQLLLPLYSQGGCVNYHTTGMTIHDAQPEAAGAS